MPRSYSNKKKANTNSGGFQQNHGVPGVVYILENEGLAPGLVKIGCSRRNGAARANELNREATTGLPGSFRCVVEFRTRDCGRAEKRVHLHFKDQHVGKRGQEFFRIGVEDAKMVIATVCRDIDAEIAQAAKQAAAADKAKRESANKAEESTEGSESAKVLAAAASMINAAKQVDARLNIARTRPVFLDAIPLPTIQTGCVKKPTISGWGYAWITGIAAFLIFVATGWVFRPNVTADSGPS